MEFRSTSQFLIFSLALMMSVSACSSRSSGSAAAPEISLARVRSTTPVAGAGGVALSTTVSAEFSALINSSSITTGTFTLFFGSNQVPGRVETIGQSVRFIPTQPLSANTQYIARLSETIQDSEGRNLGQAYEWDFQTLDTLRPQLIGVTPIPNQAQVPLSSDIRVNFSEDMNPSTIDASTFTVRVNGSAPIAGSVQYLPDSRTAVFRPAQPLLPTQSVAVPGQAPNPTNLYTVTLSASIQDLAGNSLANGFQWSFTGADTIPPSVESTDPLTNIPFDPANSINATFVEPLEPSSINASSFLLQDDVGNPLQSQAISYNDRVASFQFPNSEPFLGLFPNSLYTARLTQAIRDPLNNYMAADYVWTFRTRSGWSLPLTFGDNSLTPSRFQVAYDPVHGNFRAIYVSLRFPGDPTSGIFERVVERYPSAMSSVEITGTALRSGIPNFAIAADGTIHYVWQQVLVSGEAPSWVYRTRSPDGTLDPQTVAIDHDGSAAGESAGVFVDPQVLVAADGTVYAVFTQIVGGTTRLIANRKPPGGSWLSAPPIIDLTGSPNPVNNFSVAITPSTAPEPGVVYVAFAQNPGGTGVPSKAFVTRSLPNGNWSAPQQVSRDVTPVSDSNNPQIAAGPDGRVYVAWSQRLSATPALQSVLVNERDPSTSQWLNGVNIPSVDVDGDLGGLDATDPKILVTPNGIPHVIFRQQLTGSPNVLYENRKVNGSWQQGSNIPVVLAPVAGDFINSYFATYTDDNHVSAIILYQYGSAPSPGSPGLISSRLTWNGSSYASWSPVTRLDNPPPPQTPPSTSSVSVQSVHIARSPNSVFVMYPQRLILQLFTPPNMFTTTVTETTWVNQYR